jgi:hypothetical protein
MARVAPQKTLKDTPPPLAEASATEPTPERPIAHGRISGPHYLAEQRLSNSAISPHRCGQQWDGRHFPYPTRSAHTSVESQRRRHGFGVGVSPVFLRSFATICRRKVRRVASGG